MPFPNSRVFLRNLLLTRPDISLEGVLAEWNNQSFFGEDRPDSPAVARCRYALKVKYGFDSLDEVPHKDNGTVNISGMLRILAAKYPDRPRKRIEQMLADDGFQFSPALWKHVQPLHAKKAAPAEPASPDPKQHAGPRARLRGKGGRKAATAPVAAEASQPAVKAASPRGGYLRMEEDIDALMQQARDLMDSELVAKLRDLRREVILKSVG